MYLEKVSLPEIEEIAESEWRTYIANLAWENISPDLHENAAKCFKLFNEGVEVAEIAKQLDIVEGSVYVYKKRVEQKLIKEIKSLEEDLG